MPASPTDLGDHGRAARPTCVTPAGLWKFGIVYSNLTRRPAARQASIAASSASGNQPVVVHRDVHDLRLVGAEGAERADVGRRLGENDVTGVAEHPGDQIERHLRADGDHHVVGVRLDALQRHDLADLLAQLGDALAGAVLQRDQAVLGDQLRPPRRRATPAAATAGTACRRRARPPRVGWRRRTGPGSPMRACRTVRWAYRSDVRVQAVAGHVGHLESGTRCRPTRPGAGCRAVYDPALPVPARPAAHRSRTVTGDRSVDPALRPLTRTGRRGGPPILVASRPAAATAPDRPAGSGSDGERERCDASAGAAVDDDHRPCCRDRCRTLRRVGAARGRRGRRRADRATPDSRRRSGSPG